MDDQRFTASECCLILMFKAPVAGTVKTRLGEAVGMERAASIYQRMVELLVGGVVCSPARVWIPMLCYAPPESLDSLRDWLGSFASTDARWIAQVRGDLGERLEAAFDAAFEAGARSVVALGADCLELSVGDLREVFEALEEHDLVIGPAEDGGYWTIGISGKHDALFRDMPWSQEGLFRATLECAARLGLRVKTLATRNDIDTVDDLRSLPEELRRELGTDG